MCEGGASPQRQPAASVPSGIPLKLLQTGQCDPPSLPQIKKRLL